MIAALLLAFAAFAGADGGSGATTLKRPLGARGVSMAGAFSAVKGGLDSLTYNPAGLAFMNEREARTDYTHGIIDDKFTFLGYGQPLKDAGLAAGLAYYDAGTVTLKYSSGGSETRRIQQDWVGHLGGGARFGSLALGAVGRVYRLTLVQEFKATGAALDAGALWSTPLAGLSLSAAMQNAGPGVKFDRESDPLPLTFRAGAAYELATERQQRFDEGESAFQRIVLAGDVIKERDEKIAAAAGLELQMPFGARGYGALRTGYVFNRDLDAFSIGLGMREGRFVADYALGVKKALGNDHHISLGVRF